MRLRVIMATATIVLLTGSLASGQSRTEHDTFPNTVYGYKVGSCGGFDIRLAFEAVIDRVVTYDGNGLRMRLTWIYRVIGHSTYYNSSDPDKFVLGGPGEVETDHTIYENGVPVMTLSSGTIFKIILPGYGPIFLETGRVIYDFETGQYAPNSGHNQWVDQDLAALCSVLE